MPNAKNPWRDDEAAYLNMLEHARHMFAWCLARYGRRGRAEALAEAASCYPYQAPFEQYRGFVFHDTAWHWAMVRIEGESYWTRRPELQTPSREYELESERNA